MTSLRAILALLIAGVLAFLVPPAAYAGDFENAGGIQSTVIAGTTTYTHTLDRGQCGNTGKATFTLSWYGFVFADGITVNRIRLWVNNPAGAPDVVLGKKHIAGANQNHVLPAYETVQQGQNRTYWTDVNKYFSKLSDGVVKLELAATTSTGVCSSFWEILSFQLKIVGGSAPALPNGDLREISALPTGWSDGYIPTGSAIQGVSAVNDGGVRRAYYMKNGELWEATALSTGWSHGRISTYGSVSAISAVIDGGVRRVYTIESGRLHEYSGLSTGWAHSEIPTSGTVQSISAMAGGGRRVYAIENGDLHEITGFSGWVDSYIRTRGTIQAISAVMDAGLRRVYAIENGVLREISGLSTGWSDAKIDVPGSFQSISAIIDNGTRRVYAIQWGQLHEVTASPNGWVSGHIPTNLPVQSISAVWNGTRRVYAVE